MLGVIPPIAHGDVNAQPARVGTVGLQREFVDGEYRSVKPNTGSA
jgi:hypothetical protein